MTSSGDRPKMPRPPRRRPFQFGIRGLLILTAAVAYFFAFVQANGEFSITFLLYGFAVVLLVAAMLVRGAAKLLGKWRPELPHRVDSVVKMLAFLAGVAALAALLANWGTILGLLIQDRSRR